jgi:AraC-like DNA-binding protein
MVSQLHITHIGSFPKAPHHYVERGSEHPSAILFYCTAGRGWLELGQQRFSIQPGHAVVIPPYTPHLYGADQDEPWSLFWIHFSGPQTQRVLDSLQLTCSSPLLYVPDVDAMRLSFEEVYACLNYNYSDAGLLAMTSELMRLLSRMKLDHSSSTRNNHTNEECIESSIEFMKNHLDMALTLSDLSTRSGLSVPQYSKLFRERTDQSPMAYYTALKIRKACDLLYQTRLTVREIGLKLGYEDPYYFSRAFKKVQGCAPAHYRTNIMHG